MQVRASATQGMHHLLGGWDKTETRCKHPIPLFVPRPSDGARVVPLLTAHRPLLMKTDINRRRIWIPFSPCFHTYEYTVNTCKRKKVEVSISRRTFCVLNVEYFARVNGWMYASAS